MAAAIRVAVPFEDGLEPGTRFLVLNAASKDDEAARHAADDAVERLRAKLVDVTVDRELPAGRMPDGILVVGTEASELSALVDAAERLRAHAVSFALVADDPAEASALAHRTRLRLRKHGVFVLDRQVIMPRGDFGVYGLESEALKDRLDALIDLLEYDADRLLAKRTGWEEPEEASGAHWEPARMPTEDEE